MVKDLITDWLNEIFRKKEPKVIRRIDTLQGVILTRLNHIETAIHAKLDKIGKQIMANTEALTKLRDGTLAANQKLVKVLDILNKLQSEAGQLTPEQQRLIDEATAALDDIQVKLDTELAESTPPGEEQPAPLARRGRR